MNESIPQTRGLGRRLPRFTSDKGISHLNPRDIDATIMDRLEALSNIEVRYGPKLGAVLSDRRLIITVPQVGGTSSTAIKMFAITSLTDADYFLAKPWDGKALGSSPIAIAKSPRLRPSVLMEMVDGVVINYQNIDENNRVADDGTDSESQVIFPRYTTLDDLGLAQPDALSNCQAVIFAAQARTGIVDSQNKPITWIELQPARVWARRYAQ